MSDEYAARRDMIRFLHELRQAAGGPSLRAIAQACPSGDRNKTTIDNVLTGRSLTPRWPLMEDIARALDATNEQLATLKGLHRAALSERGRARLDTMVRDETRADVLEEEIKTLREQMERLTRAAASASIRAHRPWVRRTR